MVTPARPTVASSKRRTASLRSTSIGADDLDERLRGSAAYFEGWNAKWPCLKMDVTDIDNKWSSPGCLASNCLRSHVNLT